MRILLLALLASCGTAGESFKPATLPPLVAAQQAAQAIAPHELLLIPGEHMVFQVRLHGIDVGKVELAVSDNEVSSRFATDSIAGALMSVHHDLSTVLDRPNARMTVASENLAVGDSAKHFDMDGKNGQSLHAALGILRAWVASDAAPGFLTVQELGKTYRLAVTRPLVEDLDGTKTFHVSATANVKEQTQIQMWFAVTPDHKPLRFEITNEDFHVLANLIPT